MKNSRNYLTSLSFLCIVLLSSCNYSPKSTSSENNGCDFVSKEIIKQWTDEFKNPSYDVYRNFNEIAFPKELIIDPLTDNKHIYFNFGRIEGTQQWFYLFAAIGSETVIDYSTILYFSKELNKWVPAEKEMFMGAKSSWKSYTGKPLPTLGFKVPNDDVKYCPHFSNSIIRVGIDKSSEDLDFRLKLYFHINIKDENPEDDFDALLPCPPLCVD